MKKMLLFLLVTLTCSVAARAANPGVYIGCSDGYSFYSVYNGYGVLIYASVRLNSDCNRNWTVQIMTFPANTLEATPPHDPGMETHLNNTFDPAQMTSNIPTQWRTLIESSFDQQQNIPVSYVHAEHLNQNVANYLLANQ